jgi:hypothetical protein
VLQPYHRTVPAVSIVSDRTISARSVPRQQSSAWTSKRPLALPSRRGDATLVIRVDTSSSLSSSAAWHFVHCVHGLATL